MTLFPQLFVLMAYWRDWWTHRLITRVVHTSAEVMLHEAARQFREELTEPEKERLVRQYGRWLQADEARLLALVNAPIRTIHLFLSDVIG